MPLASFISWCDHTAVAVALRDSTWMFPVVEAVHLLGLALLGGSILLIDLRALGVGLAAQRADTLMREARPWLIASLIATVISGVLLFLSEATKCYENPAFWLKMVFLAVAIVYTFTVRIRIAQREVAVPRWTQFAAILSILLWLGVGVTGRGIGFW